VNFPAQLAHGDDSRASSLGPSDSASQQTQFEATSQQSQFDPTFANAVKELLESIEAPSVQPGFLKPTVLWYYEDCQKDKSEGDIVTKANPHRPKMHLAICRADGTKIPRPEYNAIYKSAETIYNSLVALVGPDSRLAMDDDDPKLPTRTIFKSLYPGEFTQAYLQLEVWHPCLHLCSAHWKAETILNQMFLQRSTKDVLVGPCSALTSNRLEPSPAVAAPPIPPASNVSPVNPAKRALESSPGPKSPSASQVQKHSRDNTTTFGQKMTGFSVPSNNRMCFI
jgi:hypothetical protein